MKEFLTQSRDSRKCFSFGLFILMLYISAMCSSTSATSPASSLPPSFTFSPGSSAAGQAVQFVDDSLGAPTSWFWSFIDGTTNTLQNPSHTFEASWSYNVILTIMNDTGSQKAGLSVSVSQANVIKAASASFADVSSAVSKAKAGDTVLVPAGTATWANQLIITKGIILKGSGADSTIITSSYAAPSMENPSLAGNYLIVYNPAKPKNDEPFRLSGFSFDMCRKCIWLELNGGYWNEPLTKIRIDHNKVDGVIATGGRGIAIYGNVSGVADNNIFKFDTIRFYNGYDNDSWIHLTFNYGSANTFYVEDNTWTTSDSFTSSGGGGRWCVRHNTIISTCTRNSAGFDAHGNQGGGACANLGCEIYGNTITQTLNKGIKLLDHRGGRGMVYDNDIISTAQPWIAQTEETNDYDNTYPVDQIDGQPQHLSDGYYFRNKWNGVYWTDSMYIYIVSTINYGAKPPYRVVPQENLDFWAEKASYDGSSGIGAGTLANRPKACSKGVAYWATDKKVLYRCTAPNTWELYYRPYTYPHPLRTILSD